MVLMISAIIMMLMFRIVENFGDRIAEFAYQGYLSSLLTQLKNVQLLYERKEISKDEYERISSQLRSKIEVASSELQALRARIARPIDIFEL